MKVQIPNRFKKFNPDGPDTLSLHIIECKNCTLILAVDRWEKDTPCPLCGDNAIRDYETLEYLDEDINEEG